MGYPWERVLGRDGTRAVFRSECSAVPSADARFLWLDAGFLRAPALEEMTISESGKTYPQVELDDVRDITYERKSGWGIVLALLASANTETLRGDNMRLGDASRRNFVG